MKILIAEDERTSRIRLERRLERMGHDVRATEDGAEAWEVFQGGEFPIVITDWTMPEMDGLALIRHIRESDRHRYVYIILLTAKSEKEEIVQGMEAGADDFLSKPFDSNELRVRVAAGERIITLERSLADRNASMQRDLDAAASIQQSMLPAHLPEINGARFAWRFQTCDELGGDSLNLYSLDDKHVALYVADVSGHGVAASLLAVAINRLLVPMESASSLLLRSEGSSRRITPPHEVAAELNERFPMDESGKFFTMLYGILNVETLDFRYVSAGHPPAVCISQDGRQQRLATGDPIIGLLPEADFRERVLRLKRGDRLYIYSDGVTEAMSSDLQQFGDDRMLAVLTRSSTDSLDDSVATLMAEISRWCSDNPKDDVTILAAEILPS